MLKNKNLTNKWAEKCLKKCLMQKSVNNQLGIKLLLRSFLNGVIRPLNPFHFTIGFEVVSTEVAAFCIFFVAFDVAVDCSALLLLVVDVVILLSCPDFPSTVFGFNSMF